MNRRLILTAVAIAMSSAVVANAGMPPCSCPGDADGDGLIDFDDLSVLLGSWGSCPLPCPPGCEADFDANCVVDFDDLSIMLAGWGVCEIEEQEDPGPTIPLALDIGSLSAIPFTACEFIGPGDQDTYEFTLTEAQTVNIALTNRVDGIRAWLVADLDQDGIRDGNEILVAASSSVGIDLALIEDLVPGIYHIMLEAYDNDFTGYALRITSHLLPTTTIDPGHTLVSAMDVGDLDTNPSVELQDVVGGYDAMDIIRFVVNTPQAVTANLVGRTEGGWIEMSTDLDHDGIVDGDEILAGVWNAVATDVSLIEDLEPGIYHLRIRSYDTDDSTRYTLQIEAESLPTDPPSDPGETLITAHDLGVVNAPFQIREVIGGVDDADVYRFDVTDSRAVSFSLTGREEGAWMQLMSDLDGDFFTDGDEPLSTNWNSVDPDFSINEDLSPGTYFLTVRSYDDDDTTRYSLLVSSITLPESLPADPGSTLFSAADLGDPAVAPTELFGVVGGPDRGDVYRITINDPQAVVISLTARTEGTWAELLCDLDGDLIPDANETLVTDWCSTATDYSLLEDLPTGTYFLRVLPYDTDDSTQYTLRITGSRLPVSPITDPGATLPSAFDLGPVSATPSILTQVVGSSDGVDVYRLSVSEATTLIASMTGRTEGTWCAIVDDANVNGLFDANEDLDVDWRLTNADFSLSSVVEAGVYYIWIRPYDTDDSTRYDLAVFTTG